MVSSWVVIPIQTISFYNIYYILALEKNQKVVMPIQTISFYNLMVGYRTWNCDLLSYLSKR